MILDQRISDGKNYSIILEYHPVVDLVEVIVWDIKEGNHWAIEVADHKEAREVFEHPFPYIRHDL